MSDLIYVMDCGCRLERSQLVCVKNTKLTCPDHHTATIMYKEYACERCGKICTANKMAKNPKYCADCKKEVGKERSRQQTINRRKRPERNYALESMHRRAMRKTYICTHRPQCLAEIMATDPNQDFIPCHNCEKYTPDEIMSQSRTHGGDYERRIIAWSQIRKNHTTSNTVLQQPNHGSRHGLRPKANSSDMLRQSMKAMGKSWGLGG